MISILVIVDIKNKVENILSGNTINSVYVYYKNQFMIHAEIFGEISQEKVG